MTVWSPDLCFIHCKQTVFITISYILRETERRIEKRERERGIEKRERERERGTERNGLDISPDLCCIHCKQAVFITLSNILRERMRKIEKKREKEGQKEKDTIYLLIHVVFIANRQFLSLYLTY